MTPDEQLYRDMWMAECWSTVHEWIRPVEIAAPPVEKPVEKRRGKVA